MVEKICRKIRILGVSLLCLCSVSVADAENFSRRDLQGAFLKIAFGVEVQDADSRPGIYIRKFAGGIRYHIQSTDQTRANEVRSRMSYLVRVTGIDAKEVTTPKRANYFIHIYPVEKKKSYNRKIMREHGYTVSAARLARYDNSNCRFSIFPSPSGTQKSIVFLPIVSEPDWSYCLSEELIQAFGLLNDAEDVPQSTLNDFRDSKGFAPFDLHLLRMLNDARIQPGMNAQDVARSFDQEFPRPTPELPFSQQSLDGCRYRNGGLVCSSR